MTTVEDLRDFFGGLDYKVIIAADGETRTHRREEGRIIEQTPAGGVSVAFDVLCQAAGATYIARGRTEEDREVVGPDNAVQVNGPDGSYRLKRLFLSSEEEEAYYAGFANQTLWPLCHAAFERPIFRDDWFAGYDEVNRRFAEAVQQEMNGHSFIWLNDYHLALAPSYLKKGNGTVIALFWHIPWPTWEIFRILPYKRELLTSLLNCDYIAFHRRYQARNFLNAVEQELGARIDFESDTVYVDSKSVRVASLPMGIDVDVIRNAFVQPNAEPTFLDTLRSTFSLFTPSAPEPESEQEGIIAELCARYRVLLGVDRLDYTKGIPERLHGIDRFFDENPEYRGKVVYIGIMSPTRNAIPAYQQLRCQVEQLADEINAKYQTDDWAPLHMIYDGFTRDDVVELYREAALCLVTPVDDGMNLVSKEFVIAASCSFDPGMLVLSQFAGSASDLTAALLVNPYATESVATAIKMGLEMNRAERVERITLMAQLLDDNNVYEWAMSFVRNAITAKREQQHEILEVRRAMSV